MSQTQIVRHTCQDGPDASSHFAPQPSCRTRHRHRHRPARPPDQASGRPTAPRRHRGDRPCRSRPRRRRLAGRRRRRRGAQREAVDLRPLSQPRPGGVDQRGHPAGRRSRGGRLPGAPRGRHRPPGRQHRLRRHRADRSRRAPRRRDRRQGHGRRPRGPVGAARGVRRQHDGIPQARARPAARRRGRARRGDADLRAALPHRGPGLRLQGRSRRPAALHPRVQAGADRCRRRRRRARRGRLHARHHHRRHGLGHRRRAALRRRGGRPRLSGRPGARASTGSTSSACPR